MKAVIMAGGKGTRIAGVARDIPKPMIPVEGQPVLENIPMDQAVTADVTVEDGELNLSVTTPDSTLCINLCYIKIYMPKEPEVTVTPTPEPTATPAPTEAPTEAPSPEDNSISDTAVASGADTKKGSNLPLIAGAALAIGTIAGAFTYLFRKRKK